VGYHNPGRKNASVQPIAVLSAVRW